MDLKGNLFDEVGMNSDFIVQEEVEQSIINRTFLWLAIVTSMVFGIGYYVLGMLQSGAIELASYVPYFYGSFILGFILVIAISFGASKFNYITLSILFLIYGVLEGIGLAGILLMYSQAAAINAFAGASVLFISMALWGYATKKDLSSWGNILFIGLISIIVMSLLNVFVFKSGQMDTIICIVGILIFLGLTAFDMQKLKELAPSGDRRLEIFFGLALYLNFINIFLFLLRLMSDE